MMRRGMWWILAAVLVILLPARFLVMGLFLETESGFYRDGGQWATVIAGVSAAVALALFAFSWKRNWDVPVYRPRALPRAGVTGILSGAAVVVQSLYSIFQMVRNEASSPAAVGSQSILSSLSAIIGIFAGLSLVIWGGSLLKSGRLLEDYPLVGLVPPIWGCLQLTFLFTAYTAESNIQENYYTIFPFCLAPLFLLAQSSYFSGTENGKSRKKLFRFGAPLVLLGLLSSVPPLISMAAGMPQDSRLSVPDLLVLLALSLHAVFVMWDLRQGEGRMRLQVHLGIPYRLRGFSSQQQETSVSEEINQEK